MKQKNNPFITPLQNMKGKEQITYGDILHVYGRRSFGFIIFFLALIIVIPTGFIPGVAIGTGLVTFVVVTQMAIGFKQVWIPEWLENKQISVKIIDAVILFSKKNEFLFDYLVGKVSHVWLFRKPFSLVTAALLVLVALSTIPLTLIVILETIPGAVMMLFGLAIAQQDGRWLIAAWLVSLCYLSGFVLLYQNIIELFS